MNWLQRLVVRAVFPQDAECNFCYGRGVAYKNSEATGDRAGFIVQYVTIPQRCPVCYGSGRVPIVGA